MIYLLFSYNDYYPSGGMGDCDGIFLSLQDAKDAYDPDRHYHDYVEIVEIDGVTHRVVTDWDHLGWSDDIRRVFDSDAAGRAAVGGEGYGNTRNG